MPDVNAKEPVLHEDCIQGTKKLDATTQPQRIPIRTTFDYSTTVQYAGLILELTMKARSTVKDLDPDNNLTFLRIRSKKHEIMVAAGTEFIVFKLGDNQTSPDLMNGLVPMGFHKGKLDKEYLLIAVQEPCA